MSTKYDEKVLQGYVDSLYAQARWIVFWCALRAVIIGAVGGAVAGIALFFVDRSELPDPVGAIRIATGICAGIGLLVGLSRGFDRAFQLKLEAQRVLCQMQIERNTRPAMNFSPTATDQVR